MARAAVVVVVTALAMLVVEAGAVAAVEELVPGSDSVRQICRGLSQ
jgi:hypothetical protein